jgi:hypothetical protein
MALTLQPCECVRGMTQQYQLAYIYEAIRQLAGSPDDLPDSECLLGLPEQNQLAYIFCATLAWRDAA